MELTPEIRAQLEQQKQQCVFCKIVSKEVASQIVFEDKFSLAILDIFPMVKGHSVFMLKEHYPIMPYIPTEEFKHLFGSLPQLSKAIQDAMVSPGSNIFIANGWVAGQQASHFLMHILPREKGDGLFNFYFKPSFSLGEKEINLLAHHFPPMVHNHFKRNPAEWHKSSGEIPRFLKEIYEQNIVLYEDEKVLVIIPKKGIAPGHIEVYSKTEEKDFTKLSVEDSTHIFFITSLVATAIFEGLGAQGTNIIVKHGKIDDNPAGNLSFHVIPRKEGDHLQGLWQPSQKRPSYDLKKIANSINDKSWKVNYKEKKEEVKYYKTPVIKISSKSSEEEFKEQSSEQRNKNSKLKIEENEDTEETEENEIASAIKKIRN